MTILIKGMKMAENCYSCKLGRDQGSGIKCRIAGQIYTNISNRPSLRPSWCPPTEVLTPHGRLIDVNTAIILLQDYYNREKDTFKQHAIGECIMIIKDDVPTVIEAEEDGANNE